MKNKQRVSVLALALLFAFLTGCGGVTSQIEEVTYGSTSAVVRLKDTAAWDDKTDAEKVEFAQSIVQNCMDESADELTTIQGRYGTYPSRTVFYYHAEDFPNITVDEVLIEEYFMERDQRLKDLTTDTVLHVDHIALFGLENGIAYYDAFLVSSAVWNWNTASEQEQLDLVEKTIAVCAKKYTGDGATLYEIMGYTEDGNIAFSWRGGASVKIYINGKHHTDIALG